MHATNLLGIPEGAWDPAGRTEFTDESRPGVSMRFLVQPNPEPLFSYHDGCGWRVESANYLHERLGGGAGIKSLESATADEAVKVFREAFQISDAINDLGVLAAATKLATFIKDAVAQIGYFLQSPTVE